MLDGVCGTSSCRSAKAAGKLADLMDVIPGSPAQVPSVDLPEAIREVAALSSLAAQGFNSINDKLQNFLTKRDTLQ